MSTDAQPPYRVVPPSRRRDKPILSCSLCRRRKLKCDRQLPCKTCVDRGLSLSCTYARNIPAPGTATSAQDSKAPHNVHDRIDQLEKLVTSLMENKSSDHASNEHSSPALSAALHFAKRSDTSNTDTEIPGTPDQVRLESDRTSYTNSGHWTSILDGIAELKEHLDDIPIAPHAGATKPEIAGPDLLFGRQRHATKQEILAGLPPRHEADQLIVTYFASMDMSPAIMHRPTFLREYDRFWQQPFDTPVMWIGLLFSMLSLATRFQSVIEDCQAGLHDPSDVSLSSARMDFYREKCVQCLILANYAKCPPYTIETFLQYFVTEYLRSRDTQFTSWVLVGMIVRMAFRMGYHREPSRFPNISPFKAEMRRRIWAMIVQLDLMSSNQVGLPRMIQPLMYDTGEPQNLLDDDFHEDITELPDSRPDTDATPMLYTLIRNRVLHVFAQIIDITNATAQPPYREIMELDAALRNVYDNIPQSMKAIRAREFEKTDSDLAMRRLYLGLTFLKAELMLHRPFLLLGRVDTRYEYSRLACLDAAMEILEFQKELDTESRPGGTLWSTRWQLWTVSWRMSSLINHDFLLATTVLSLDLDKDLAAPMPVSEENMTNRVRFKHGQPTRAEVVEALTGAYAIWIRASEKSQEAAKVAAAVKLVLGKANASPEHQSETTPPSYQFETSTSLPSYRPPNFANATASWTAFEIENPHFSPPFPMGDMTTDFGAGFNWGDLETEFPMPNFEQSLHEAYLG